MSVVYNCSNAMDIPSILKILMGVVTCGAWICFDDLNRLDLGVLSVLSKHIQGILMEIAAGNTKVWTTRLRDEDAERRGDLGFRFNPKPNPKT